MDHDTHFLIPTTSVQRCLWSFGYWIFIFPDINKVLLQIIHIFKKNIQQMWKSIVQYWKADFKILILSFIGIQMWKII